MIVGSWGWMWHFLLVLWRSTARNNYRITCSKILTIERNGQNPISHQAANQQNKVAQTAVPSSLALPCPLCPPCLIAVRLSGCQVAGAAAQCIKHHCDITQAIGGSFTLSIQISVISAISKDHDIFLLLWFPLPWLQWETENLHCSGQKTAWMHDESEQNRSRNQTTNKFHTINTTCTKTIWVKYCAFIITLAFQCEGKPPPGTTFSQKKLAWPSRGTDVARQAESCKAQRSWSPNHVFRIAHQPKNIKKSCLRAPKRNGTFTNRLAS